MTLNKVIKIWTFFDYEAIEPLFNDDLDDSVLLDFRPGLQQLLSTEGRLTLMYKLRVETKENVVCMHYGT
jgi:hypothetical protein